MKDVFGKESPALRDCSTRFSFFFDLIKPEFSGGNSAPFHRICTLMRKMGARSFTREELVPDDELNGERRDVETEVGGAVGWTAMRFTFFRAAAEGASFRDVPEDTLLGYAVLISLTLPDGKARCYVLEAVVRLPSLWIGDDGAVRPKGVVNYYVHNRRDFQTTVGPENLARHFRLHGSFFCQQNGVTHVCAHAALRTAINNSPAYRGAKLTNRRINEVFGVDHRTKRIGRYGPGPADEFITGDKQLARAVEDLGWDYKYVDFGKSREPVYYGDYIYPFIESNCPVLLGIETPGRAESRGPREDHVVAVIGHTMNTDRWTPEAWRGYGGSRRKEGQRETGNREPVVDYISASAWADHFIVNDDNYGMYVTLPSEAVSGNMARTGGGNLSACFALALVPPGVRTPGYIAERWAARVADKLLAQPVNGNRWLDLLRAERKKHPFVCRTLLQDKADYLEKMREIRDELETPLHADDWRKLEASLDQSFWLTEITIPNIYTGNRRKLGDVITHANMPEEDFLAGNGATFAWLPGIAWRADAATALQAWSLRGHVPLLRDASDAEWPLAW